MNCINFRNIVFDTLLVLWMAGTAGAQAYPNAKPGREVDLVRPDSPAFDSAMDIDYPGLRKANGFREIRPLVALLLNNSHHGIKAYVVRWTIIDGRGRTITSRLIPWAEAGGREDLTGEEIVWKPNEPRLVSPLFSWGVSPFANRDEAALLDSFGKGSLAVLVSSARNISISLDAVVYDDGVFSGPDVEGFFNMYQFERNGEQQEAQFVLGWLTENLPDDQIIARLNEDANQSLVSVEGRDQPSVEKVARGREAKRLLDALNRGRPQLTTLCRRVLSYKQAKLVREGPGL